MNAPAPVLDRQTLGRCAPPLCAQAKNRRGRAYGLHEWSLRLFDRARTVRSPDDYTCGLAGQRWRADELACATANAAAPRPEAAGYRPLGTDAGSAGAVLERGVLPGPPTGRTHSPAKAGRDRLTLLCRQVRSIFRCARGTAGRLHRVDLHWVEVWPFLPSVCLSLRHSRSQLRRLDN